MLLAKPSFILRYAVRNYINLFSPKINKKDEVIFPKQSVIHYIGDDANVRFPTKDLYYFSGTPSSKKIKVQTIYDLAFKEGNPILKNKYINRDIRTWYRKNAENFRFADIINTPVLDDTTVSLINYGAIKSAYKYVNSPLSKWRAYENFYSTYLANVKKVIQTHPGVMNFIPLTLPTLLYGYNTFRRIAYFNIIKMTRVVKDDALMNIVQLFLWLDPKTRSNSVYKEITDLDSTAITIEVQYKDRTVYLPLSILLSLSESSELPSKLKKTVDKVQKMFILFLLITQTSVEKSIDVSVIDDAPKIDSDGTTTTSLYTDAVTPNISKQVNDAKILNLNEQLEQETEKDIDIDAIEKEYENTELDELFDKDELLDGAANGVESELTFTATDQEISDLIKEKPLADKYNEYLESLLDVKAASSSELRTARKLIEKRKILASPYEPNRLLDEARVVIASDKAIDKQELTINIHNPLVAEDMQQDILSVMDNKYIDTVMKKDILACVTNIENAGILIKSYTVEQEQSKLGNYEIHRLVLKPLLGKESTIYFKLPKINNEGEFVASSIKVKLRKQKTDLPIRKIAPNRVGLTSNYGKLFVTRSEKKAYDYYSYLSDYIRKSYIQDIDNGVKILSISLGNTFENKKSLPNIYCAMSMVFNRVKIQAPVGEYTFVFNSQETANLIKAELIEEISERPEGFVFCGFNTNNIPIVVDKTDMFYLYGKEFTPIGKMEDILAIPTEKLPNSFTNIKVLGKDMPLGIALSYYLGLSNLIKITKANPTIIPASKQYKLPSGEYQLKFEDYKLIFNKSNKEASLLLSGFLYFKDFIKEYKLSEFNKESVYLPLLVERDFNTLYVRELDMLRDLYLDPITVDVLSEMSEPTEFIALLLRANSLLTTMSHPDVNDSNYTRIRGYERVPGLMYKAFTESVRAYKFRTNRSDKVELSPYAVWNNIVMDNSKKLTEDINPINDLKEMESVTLVGQDGLSKEAISSKLREYTASDMGVTSESTVDSSDVGVNTFLTPYARFKNIRGMVDTQNTDYETNPAKLLSTTALLVPGVENDDPRRVNFAGIQNSHTIASKDYHQPLLRTGYEYIVPHRVGKLFCYAAKDNGKVIHKTDKIFTIEYKNGKKVTIPIGRQHGLAEGTTYPHDIVSDLQTGDSFKKDDIITYNTNFFEKDWVNPKQIILKTNTLASTALTISNEVYEDSSAISHKLSEKLTSKITKVKSFVLEFSKNIIKMLPVGSVVQPDTVLFTILDETSDVNNLSEDTVKLLSNMANISPKAKLQGIIDKYEIYYNGSISDMSPTLKKLAKGLDAQIKIDSKYTDLQIESNSVNSEYRVDGNNLQLDTVEIKVYITIDVTAGSGDKLVFAAQLKSVIGDVMHYDVHTEDNREIQAMFGFKSINNRIVLSPYIVGTTNTLLKEVSKQVAAEYFS